jgi:hypothetical protein
MKMTALVGSLIIAVSAVAVFSVAFAQETGEKFFTVGGNVLVSAAAAERPLVEPQVVAHPKDPRHLVAVAIVSSEPPHQPQADCAAFTSFDGGQTWAQHNFGISNCGDPWVALREDGSALFAGLAPRGEIRLLRSTDGGRIWAPVPVDLGRGHDHQTVIVDTSSGPRAGSFYVVSGRMQRNNAGRSLSSVFVARSADGGRTFRPPVDVVASNLNSNTLTPGVLSDGTLVVPYLDFQSNVDDFKSTGFLERKRLWVVTSSDGGQTFSHPMFVSEACGSGGGFASLAVDASTGPSRDRLYLTCTNRDRNTIFVHYSSDRGEHWSAPVRANSAASEVIFRRTPSIAVNKDGVVGVTWYERQKDGARECQHIYFTASLDGGKTFLPEARVSSAPSCPDTPRNGGSAKRWPAGGDYSGLAAAADGSFHVLWSDSRNGMYQLWSARVQVNAAAK